MRFLFCDRIVGIIKGESIEGVKVFSLSEEYLNDHFANRPLVPGTILVETMAQSLGWLISYSHDFQCMPIISLLEDVEVSPTIGPGVAAQVRSRLVSTTPTDSLGQSEIHVDGKMVAQAKRMIYRHFPVPDPLPLTNEFNVIACAEIASGAEWRLNG